jgi:hypothetical protein
MVSIYNNSNVRVHLFTGETMSRRIVLALCLLSIALLLACSKSENSNTANGNHNTSSAPTVGGSNPGAATSAPSAAPQTASAEKIGIAVCDDFIEKYDACVTDKVPAQVRAQYTTMLSQWRDSWKKAAENPQTRGTLEQACKTAMDQAKTQMKAFNCTF